VNGEGGIILKRDQITSLFRALKADPTIEQVKVYFAADGKMRASTIQMVAQEKQLRLTKVVAKPKETEAV
jgi:hypothetical protein